MTQAATFGRRGTVAAPPAGRSNQPRPAARAPAPATATPKAAAKAEARSGDDSLIGYFLWLLFSFDGRIRRRTYWLANLSATVAISVWLWFELSMMPVLKGNPVGLLLLSLCSIVVGVAGVWSGFALQLKRWHDRDKGWPWLFMVFVPFIGGLWAFVEIGCLEGTPGDNRFGHSPKLGPAEVFS